MPWNDPLVPSRNVRHQMHVVLPVHKEKMRGKALGRVIVGIFKHILHYPVRLVGDFALVFLFNYMTMTATILGTTVLIDHVLLQKPMVRETFHKMSQGKILYWFLTPWHNATPQELLWVVLIASVGVGILAGAVMVFQCWWDNSFKIHVTHRMRVLLMEHYMKLGMPYHSTHRMGDAIYRVQNDTAMIGPLIQQGLMGPWNNISNIVIKTIGMYKVSHVLTGIFLCFLPLAILLNLLIVIKPRRAARRVRETDSRLLSTIEGSLTAIKAIIGFGREREEVVRFRNLSWHSLEWHLSQMVWTQVMFRSIEQTMSIGRHIVFFLGAYYFWEGKLTMGNWLLMVGLMMQVQQPTMQLTNLWGFLQSPLVAVDRILTILNLKPEVEDLPEAKPLEGVRQGVEFRNVSFSYDSSRNVLNEVNLRAERGTVTAVVGADGAGKSTLLGLIPRFFDASSGQVLIDGTDLRQFTISSLRKHITLLHQENPIFPTTILDNLLYGLNADTDEASEAVDKKFEQLAPTVRQRLEAAVRAACLDQFLAELPDGYDTLVGERASGLSGREQQRLAIARALIRDATVLILDEATSSLDSETEAQLLQNLRQIGKDRIIFIVPDRLSTARMADQILCLDKGEIVEQGTHEELMRLPDGHYRRMNEMHYQTEDGAEIKEDKDLPAPVGA